MSDDTKSLARKPDPGALAPEDPEAVYRDIVHKIVQSHYETLEAANRWADHDADLAKLSHREQRIAKAARLPKVEAPVGLLMAHEYAMAREKRLARDLDRNKPPINLHVHSGGQVGVVLPPRAPRTDDVAVISADDLKRKADEDPE